jgi:hypothetical protein
MQQGGKRDGQEERGTMGERKNELMQGMQRA